MSPAEAGSRLEEKEVATLAMLVNIASAPEAGLLGSGWVIVLRTLSQIDALQRELTRLAVNKLAAEVRIIVTDSALCYFSNYRWSIL